jgi:hypothetical protein
VLGCTNSSALNYNETANVDNGECINPVPGCINPLASNFNALANTSDDSCVYPYYGCTDGTALNYNPLANSDNATCIYVEYGCIYDYPFITNYSSLASINQVSEQDISDPCEYFFDTRSSVQICIDPTAENYFPIVDPQSEQYNDYVASNVDVSSEACVYEYGCTDESAYNFEVTASLDDGSCISYDDVLVGCFDEMYLEYDVNVNVSNNALCVTLQILGCIDINALNYSSDVTVDDASCIYAQIYGCMYTTALNYNPQATIADASCVMYISGCIDINSFNYNPLANIDAGDCESFIYGCTNAMAQNYDEQSNTDDFSCVYVIYGCTLETALNFMPTANTDNGSCIENIVGCTDYNATNYNATATVATYSCNYLIGGCTNESFIEYSSLADYSDGSCATQKVVGCTNSLFLEFDPLANVNDSSCSSIKVLGCTTSSADNYNPSANSDNGSCDFSNLNSAFIQALDSIAILSSVIESGVADPIYSDLLFGWNMIGYTLNQPANVEDAFNALLNNPNLSSENPIHLVKNVTGQFWSPEFGVNMLGDLLPGLGYMIYLNEAIPNFSFSEE